MIRSRHILAVLVVSVLAALLFASTGNAADARNFNAGRIIDDGVFTNSYSMSVQDIQNFLNSKVPQCDTWGAKSSEYGGGTRAQYAASRGLSTPFTCLKDYYQNPTTGADNYGGKAIPSGGLSAAQIIFNYSRQYSINPQVILATLQKENGMITDEWPFPRQYQQAMGFGCPDNVAPGAPACDPSYGSFSAQIYQAARHFRGYIDNSLGWYLPYDTGWNSILWSPNQPTCGASDVYIENRATVALYSYTPYQPNQAAKNAQYGIGDSCSAYGNRNFYLYFTDWFGSVYGDIHMVSSLNLLSSAPGALFTNGFVEASFVLRNDSDQWINAGTVAIAVRDEAGNNFDFGSEQITLAPHQEYLYRHARNFATEGKYTFWVTSYRDGIGWNDDYPSATNGSVRKYTDKIVQNKPTITVGVAADSELRKDKTSNVTFTVKSNSAYPTNLGYLGVALRDPDGVNADLPFDTISSLAPQASYVYTKPFNPKKVGSYNAYTVSYIDNNWNTNYPAPAQGIANNVSLGVKPNPTITQGLQLDTATIYAGDAPSISFKVKNYSQNTASPGYLAVAIRDPENKNADLPGVQLDSLASNQEYTFSGSRTFTKPGTYTAWIVNYKDGNWSDTSPSPESGAIAKRITFEVKQNPTLTQGLTLQRNGQPINGQTIRAGDTLQGTFKVKNNSSQTVVVNKSACFIMRGNNKNYDLGCLSVGTLAAGEEKVYTGQRVVDQAGTYRAYFSMFDGVWRDNSYFSPATGSEATQLQFEVKGNPVLSQGLTVTGQSPSQGTFVVKNSANTAVTVNKSLCMIVRKEGSNANYDFGCLQLGALQSGESATFSVQKNLPTGVYNAYFSTYDGSWRDHTFFNPETGTEPTTLRFTVN